MPEDHPHEEIVRLASAGSAQEAQLWREALEEHGIRCRIVGEYLIGMILAGGGEYPELWVHREDLAQAKSILEKLIPFPG